MSRFAGRSLRRFLKFRVVARRAEALADAASPIDTAHHGLLIAARSRAPRKGHAATTRAGLPLVPEMNVPRRRWEWRDRCQTAARRRRRGDLRRADGSKRPRGVALPQAGSAAPQNRCGAAICNLAATRLIARHVALERRRAGLAPHCGRKYAQSRQRIAAKKCNILIDHNGMVAFTLGQHDTGRMRQVAADEGLVSTEICTPEPRLPPFFLGGGVSLMRQPVTRSAGASE